MFPIETPRLLIRPFEKTDEDIAAMHKLFSDPEVVKYIGGVLSDTIEKTMERVVAVVFLENIASRRVLEKCGMTRRGTRYCYNHELAFFDCARDEGKTQC